MALHLCFYMKKCNEKEYSKSIARYLSISSIDFEEKCLIWHDSLYQKISCNMVDMWFLNPR